MPRVKKLTEMERDNAKVRGALVGKMAEYGYSRKRMADTLGMSINTFRTRVQNPDTLTLGEIRRLKRMMPGLEIN